MVHAKSSERLLCITDAGKALVLVKGPPTTKASEFRRGRPVAFVRHQRYPCEACFITDNAKVV